MFHGRIRMKVSNFQEALQVEKDQKQEIALFRYMIIAPILEPGLERAELTRRRKEILAKEYQKPNGKIH